MDSFLQFNDSKRFGVLFLENYSKYFFGFLFFGLLLLCGCTTQQSGNIESQVTPTDSVQGTPSDSVNTNIVNSAPENLDNSDENSVVGEPENLLPSETEKSCPISCDDNLPCTADTCNENTDYNCIHSALSGFQTDCSGSAGTCMEYACAIDGCIAQKINNCCGNGVCDSNENHANCPADCEISCPPSCNDNNSCTEDICNETTNYTCLHQSISNCCGNGVCDATENFSTCEQDCIRPTLTCELMASFDLTSYYADESYIYGLKSGSAIDVYDWTGNFKFDLGNITQQHVASDNSHIYGLTVADPNRSGTIYVWDKQNFTLVNSKDLTGDWFLLSVVGVDEMYLYITGSKWVGSTEEFYLKIYNKNTLELVQTITNNLAFANLKTDAGRIYALLSYSPSMENDILFKAWNKSDWGLIYSSPEQKCEGIIYYNQLELDSDYIYAMDADYPNCGNTGFIRVFRKSDFGLRNTISNTNPISLLVGQSHIYTGGPYSGQKEIKVFDKSTGQLINALDCPDSRNIPSWLLSAQGNKIARQEQDGKIKVYQIN